MTTFYTRRCSGPKNLISLPPRLLEYWSIGKLKFRMGVSGVAWKDRLSELADYRKIHVIINVTRTEHTYII